MIELTLPLPPSINSYWRSTATKRGPLGITVYISEKGQKFRANVIATVLQARANKKLTCRLQVDLVIHPADKRVQDIDNRIKATLDALTHAGVYADDSQIDRLIVCRGEIIKGGQCRVLISELVG